MKNKQELDGNTLYTSSETRKKLGIGPSQLKALVEKDVIEKVTPYGYQHGYYTKASVDEYYEQQVLFKRNYALKSDNNLDNVQETADSEETVTPQKEPSKIVFTIAHKEDMDAEYELAKKAIGETMSAERRREWYNVNPDCDFIVKDDGKVVAYIRLLPIKHETLMKVMSGEMKGAEVTADDVEPFTSGKPLECFVMGIAREPDAVVARRLRYMNVLIRGTMKELEKLGKQGVIISKFYATSITPSGIAMSLNIGMDEFLPRAGRRHTFVMDVAQSNSRLLRGYKKGLASWEKSHKKSLSNV